jgi:hypothetical protein
MQACRLLHQHRHVATISMRQRGLAHRYLHHMTVFGDHRALRRRPIR